VTGGGRRAPGAQRGCPGTARAERGCRCTVARGARWSTSEGASLEALRALLREVSQLEHASILMSWDQEVCMPAGGVRARGASLGFLRNLIHERWASDEMARLLDRLDGCFAAESLENAMLSVARRQHGLALKLPPSLTGDRARLSAEARPVWRHARAAADWSIFAPLMTRIVAINRELAEAIGYAEHPYDALLELTEPGMTTQRLREVFTDIRDAATSLLDSRPPGAEAESDAFLAGEWDERAQMQFIRRVASSLGVDARSGRIDTSAYPISNKIGPGDIRMTTNTSPRLLLRGLFGALHELGHVLYAQGLDPALEETPLWASPSFGVDESQSRLFENVLGRSRPFWKFWFPKLKLAFPGRLDDVPFDAFYVAINRVKPTPILLDADELTYNLHILVRFEIENSLLDGSLDVRDVPDAWRDGMERHLGVTVRDDAQGPLQDIHWAGCYIGAFTSYTIGDLVAAQLMEHARQAIPGLDSQIENGELTQLVNWLRTNVHSRGCRHSPEGLLTRVTGRGLSTAPWIRYITQKTADLETVRAS